MFREGLAAPFVKCRTVNQTTTGAYESKIPTATAPSGTGSTGTNASVQDLMTGTTARSSAVIIVPYGTGADTNTFKMAVLGWRSVGREVSGTALWIPVILYEATCTLSTPVGVAAKTIVATERFCDTITVISGSVAVADGLVSPGNNFIAHVIVPLAGFQFLELTFDRGGSATDCNALIALM